MGPRHSFGQLRWNLLPLAVVASGVMIVYGFTHSDILVSQPWSPTMIYQIGLLSLVVMGAVVVALVAERNWKIRLEAGLAVLGLLTMIGALGVAPVVLVGMFLLSATLLGTWLTLKLSGDDSPPPFVFVTVFGVAIYAIVFTLIGPIPINTVTLHSLLLVVPLMFAVASSQTLLALRARAHVLCRQLQRPKDRTAVEIAGFAAFLFVAEIHLLLCTLPERCWDAMVSHLYLPSYVAAHGTWSYDASLFAFAFAPNAVDWIYSHFFTLGGETASRFYNFTALMLVCATLYAIVSRIASREVAIWTTALFASMPIAFIESSSLFVENTLTLWITSAVGLIVIANLRPDLRITFMVLTLLAAATMSKLHGAVAAVVIGPVLLVLFSRGRWPIRDAAQVSVLFVVLAAIACFPYAYSWLETGNPVLPFYNDVFNSPFFPAVAFHDTRWEGNFNWSLLYDTTFASSRFGEIGTGALGLTIIIMVPLAVAAIIARRDAGSALCLGLAAMIGLLVGIQTQYLRYFYPLVPLLLVPAGAGIGLLFEQHRTRFLMFALIVAATAFNIYKLPAAHWTLSNFDLSAGFNPDARRNVELTQAPERLANKLVNDAEGGTARVLYMGDPYGGLLQGQALYTNWYNPKLAGELNEVATPEQARALLARWAVTHVIGTANPAGQGLKVLDTYLVANYRPMAQFGSITVYDVRTVNKAR